MWVLNDFSGFTGVGNSNKGPHTGTHDTHTARRAAVKQIRNARKEYTVVAAK